MNPDDEQEQPIGEYPELPPELFPHRNILNDLYTYLTQTPHQQ